MTSVFPLNKKITAILISLSLSIFFLLLSCIAMLKLLFPVCYKDSVKTYSEEFCVAPALVLAVINTESGFNRFAVSNRGAIGLMQIMPSTAKMIAQDLGIENFTESELYNAETNIRFGCYYISYLQNKFISTDEVLFAYNAGEGNLQRFLNENNGQFFFEKIKIKETYKYIHKVRKAYNLYNKWYNY